MSEMEVFMDAEVVRSVDDWAAVIRADMARTVESVLETGRHLAQAKAEVGHGNWGPLLKEVGMTTQTANRLMAVAANPVLSNRTHAYDLPSSWCTLYELSRLDAEVLESAITEGYITPEMQRKDATALIQAAKGVERPQRGPQPAPSVESSLTALWDRTAEMDGDARADVAAQLQQLVDNIGTGKSRRETAINGLKNKNGVIVPMALYEVIESSGISPTPQAAGMLAAAITHKWGSWSAFERDRKQAVNDDRAGRKVVGDALRRTQL